MRSDEIKTAVTLSRTAAYFNLAYSITDGDRPWSRIVLTPTFASLTISNVLGRAAFDI
jgi:hypothetical protein